MKRLTENWAKDLIGFTLPKPKKRTSRWTLLLAGDRGKVISIRRFKGVAITSALAIFVVAAFAIGFYFLYDRETDENKRLQDALEASRQKATVLLDEKERLMVRLVLAESKIKIGQDKHKEKTIETTSGLPQSKSISATAKSETADPKKVAETSIKLSDEKPASVSKVAASASDTSTKSMRDSEPQVVDLENLIVLNEPGNRRLRIEFKLKKTDTRIETVSGYAFLILKPDKDEQKQWFTIPSAPLISGKPSQVHRGQYFSIARFKSMQFEYKYSLGPDRFQYVTIFIYGTDEKLLMEKELPIKIQDVPAVSKE